MRTESGGLGPGNESVPRPATAVELFWIPLGAGGTGFVAFNGRVYEAIRARREHRQPLALFHTALEVRVEENRCIIENAWPSPDADTASRGVVTEGPVWTTWLGRFRTFRYEVRRWWDGVIPDIDEAVGGPVILGEDPALARRILDLVPSLPAHTWGRRLDGAPEMWNSNSVISWLVTKSGLPVDEVHPPQGGRAPGWDTGVAVARQA